MLMAFNVAKAELSADPHVLNAESEASKLLLLPEGANHDVVLIPRTTKALTSWPLSSKLSIRILTTYLPLSTR